MSGPRLLISIAILLFATCSRCSASDNNTTPSTTLKSASVEKSETTEQPLESAPNLCNICSCTDDLVNCTKLSLENHFQDSQWTSTPLAEVNFGGNNLVHIKPFPNVTINRLILSNNRITKIDDKAFKEIRNLTELDLSHNQLSAELLSPHIFEGSFSSDGYEPLAYLRVLNLASNVLHTLKQDVFEHVTSLRVLILSDNPLGVIDDGMTDAISELLLLEELDLSYCDLTSLPEYLFHAPSHLQRLNLSGNRFVTPPGSLEHCKSLEYLGLDENPFAILDNSSAFPVMPSLKELSLCCMPHLTFVGPNVFSQLTALERLTLQNCPILKEINENALVKQTDEGAIWPPLKSLNLSDNALRYLPAGLVGRWDRLEKLDIINNKWSCDCDNQYLVGNLLPNLGKSLMGSEVDKLKCSAPPEHAGKNLTSLAKRKLRCPDLYGARPERDAAILVGIMIGLLLAIPVVLTLFVFWRRGFFFCGNQGPATFSRAFYKRAAPDDEI